MILILGWNKWRLPLLSAATVLMACWQSPAANATFDESFDDYGDTPDMETVWVPIDVAGNLDTGFGNPAPSAFHPADGVNQRVIEPLLPLEERPIVVSVDIFDDGTNSNERVTLGLRTGSNNILELGHYNGILDGFHAFRVINFDGENPNWARFDLPVGQNAPTAGGAWNRFRAEITATDVTLTLDLGADGSIDALNVVAAQIKPVGFSEVRFGGPSGLSSAGGGAHFDNISISLAALPVDGDVNGDGMVDMLDYEILRDNLFTGTVRAQGDLDGDRDVDFNDFRILKDHFQAAPVPEPGACGLLLLGSLALGGSAGRQLYRRPPR